MADINHIPHKTGKQFLFETKLNWVFKKRGVLRAPDVSGTIHVATPPKFGGEGKEWSPEHLFLSSVSSCFMSTYLLFAKKLGFEIYRFECNCIGQIELVNRLYKFTHINLYPKIYIANESLREKATLALQKAQHYCLVSNSVKATLIYHSEIITKPQPVYEIKDVKTA